MLSPSTLKEKSLSYYFNLHNEEFSSPCSKSSSNRLDFFVSSIDSTRNAHPKHRPPPSSHERGQWKPLLEGRENATPLSWLSTLFSRRKRKPKARSAIENGSSSPSVHWEPPRASSWEQLSSWEKPTSSAWEKPTSSAWDLPSAEPRRASEAGIEDLEAAIAKQAEANRLIMKESPDEGRRHQSKKWIRNVLAIKWAMKLKRRLMKKQAGEEVDKASTMSTASSSARGSSYSYHSLQNGQIKGGQARVCHSQSSYYSPLHSYSSSNPPHRSKWHFHKRGESGLLRFYLTPSRSIKIATKRPRNHHPLILGL